MRKSVTIVQIILCSIMIGAWLFLALQIIGKDVAESIISAAVAIYYYAEAAVLYYEASHYKTNREEPSINFLSQQVFKDPLDFAAYKQANEVLIKQSEMWQHQHDKIRKRYIRQNATICLIAALMFSMGVFI